MKLKIGIVGYGELGKKHYNELRRLELFEVCGVFDAHCGDEFCRAPFFSDFKEFIQHAKPDAIVLCVPANEMFGTFNQCVKVCQNILLARPFFKNASEAKELKYLAGVNHARVCTGISERFAPVVVSLAKALAREEEIYSITLSHNKPSKDIMQELVCDIDLAKWLTRSDICEFAYSFSNKSGAKHADNFMAKFKSKNQILVSVTNSTLGAYERFCVEVNAKSGVYFGDLISHRLFELNANGQINLKADTDQNEIKAQYEAFYELCSGLKNSVLASVDDVIKIKELFA